MDVKEASVTYAELVPSPVPAGYKQTESGMIPEDWDEEPLGALADGIYRGASPRPIDDPVWFDENSAVGWVRISDLTAAGRYLFDTSQRLSAEGVRHSRFVPAGSLIMSICATVGRPIETRTDVCIHDGFVVFDRPRTSQEFLFHVLRDLEPRWSRKGQTGSQMNLNTRLIKSTAVPVPSTIEEQEEIAKALGDADASIAAISQLIVKKRRLKQGAMQALLGGKRRLPGFAKDWSLTTLEELGEFLKGRGVSRDQSMSGSIPCVRYGELYTHHNDIIRNFRSFISENVARASLRLKQGDILFAGSGETKGDIGKCAAFVGEGMAYAGGDIVVLRPRGCDSRYLGYALNAAEVNAQKASLGQGDAVVHISASALASVSLLLPELREQTAIANVLCDLDAEVTALEARLTKARQLKQGMMQQLLTGRIRLPLEPSA